MAETRRHPIKFLKTRHSFEIWRGLRSAIAKGHNGAESAAHFWINFDWNRSNSIRDWQR